MNSTKVQVAPYQNMQIHSLVHNPKIPQVSESPKMAKSGQNPFLKTNFFDFQSLSLLLKILFWKRGNIVAICYCSISNDFSRYQDISLLKSRSILNNSMFTLNQTGSISNNFYFTIYLYVQLIFCKYILTQLCNPNNHHK